MTPLSPFAFLGTAVMAAAAACLVWVVLEIIHASRALPAEASSFELARREKLRRGNWIYRNFEPWIDQQCVTLNAKTNQLDIVERDLKTSAAPLPWEPA